MGDDLAREGAGRLGAPEHFGALTVAGPDDGPPAAAALAGRRRVRQEQRTGSDAECDAIDHDESPEMMQGPGIAAGAVFSRLVFRRSRPSRFAVSPGCPPMLFPARRRAGRLLLMSSCPTRAISCICFARPWLLIRPIVGLCAYAPRSCSSACARNDPVPRGVYAVLMGASRAVPQLPRASGRPHHRTPIRAN